MALLADPAAGQQSAVSPIERRISGTWALVEWYFQGQVLTPPVADGRLVYGDGQVVATFHRNLGTEAYDRYAYGSYSLTQSRWTYRYARTVEITRKDGGSTVVQGTGEPVSFAIRFEGPKLIFDDQKSDRRFVFESDQLTYFEKGQVLRKWRRFKGNG